jgi:2-polyprenyl-6-methoxyphenol hydroxylase-like FAD-dependent oxidoreductase
LGIFRAPFACRESAEGNISLFWFDHGWFWFIPLSDGATSVGAVCWPYYMKSRKTGPEKFFFDTIALCPALAERLRDAKLISPVTATGNYSYEVERAAGRNYLMLGDAFTFIDPVFSTGVLFAMQSAFAGAETIATCLNDPQKVPRIASFRYNDAPRTQSFFMVHLSGHHAEPARSFMHPRNFGCRKPCYRCSPAIFSAASRWARDCSRSKPFTI